MSEYRIIEGDAAERLRELDAGSVQTCITSPPYWGLRDYGTAEWSGGDAGCDHQAERRSYRDGCVGCGVPMQEVTPGCRNCIERRRLREKTGGLERKYAEPVPHRSRERDAEIRYAAIGDATCEKCGATRIDSQLGLEPTPDEYVANLVAIFAQVRRVLRDDGTLWLNLGDSYAGSWGNQGRKPERGTQRPINGGMLTPVHDGRYPDAGSNTGQTPPGLKSKDLVGIPWRVAFALQADGWYLRSDIIWSKPNPMPESVTDRPTKAHEYLFLLAKQPRYYYDADAIREDALWPDGPNAPDKIASPYGQGFEAGRSNGTPPASGRNKRSVWTVSTQPYPGAHFATFPPKLIEPCVLAGSPPKACGECGAPYVRLTESEQKAKGWHDHSADGELGQRQVKMGQASWDQHQAPKTVGWKATCYHATSPAPDDSGTALVLDPFAGAGTTGLVALRHDRDFVGIELNPSYAQMARDRIYDDGPLLNIAIQ